MFNYKSLVIDIYRITGNIFSFILIGLYCIQLVILPQLCFMGRTCVTDFTWGGFCIFELLGSLFIGFFLSIIVSLKTFTRKKNEIENISYYILSIIKEKRVYMFLFLIVSNIIVSIIHIFGYKIYSLWKRNFTIYYFTYKTGLAGSVVILSILTIIGLFAAIFYGCIQIKMIRDRGFTINEE